MDFLGELLLSQDAVAKKEKLKLPGGALTLDQRRKQEAAERQRRQDAERRKREEERAKAEAEQAERERRRKRPYRPPKRSFVPSEVNRPREPTDEEYEAALAARDEDFARVLCVNGPLMRTVRLDAHPVVVTAAECLVAMREIRKHKASGVDCEGVNLGRHGRLTLVQLATADKVYLFDIVLGGDLLFRAGLKDYLESPSFVKVFHDVRGDSDALFHQHGVRLRGIFDTQLGFVMTRHQTRKATPLPIGLNTLLRKYADGKTNEFKDEAREGMQADAEYWLRRPMTDVQLGYARQDVVFLVPIYEKMDRFFVSDNRKLLREQCATYVKMYRDLSDEDLLVRRGKSADGFPQYGIKFFDMDAKPQRWRRRDVDDGPRVEPPAAADAAPAPADTAAAAAGSDAQAAPGAALQGSAAFGEEEELLDDDEGGDGDHDPTFDELFGT